MFSSAWFYSILSILITLVLAVSVIMLYLTCQRNLVMGYEARMALISLVFRTMVRDQFPGESEIDADYRDALAKAHEVLERKYPMTCGINYKFERPEMKEPRLGAV